LTLGEKEKSFQHGERKKEKEKKTFFFLPPFSISVREEKKKAIGMSLLDRKPGLYETYSFSFLFLS
jgi:hypothetical protein